MENKKQGSQDRVGKVEKRGEGKKKKTSGLPQRKKIDLAQPLAVCSKL